MLNMNTIAITLHEKFGYKKTDAAKLGKEIQQNLDNYLKIQDMLRSKRGDIRI